MVLVDGDERVKNMVVTSPAKGKEKRESGREDRPGESKDEERDDGPIDTTCENCFCGLGGIITDAYAPGIF